MPIPRRQGIRNLPSFSFRNVRLPVVRTFIDRASLALFVGGCPTKIPDNPYDYRHDADKYQADECDDKQLWSARDLQR